MIEKYLKKNEALKKMKSDALKLKFLQHKMNERRTFFTHI